MGRRNRSGSRRRRVLEGRLGPEAVVDKDARGKRREERYGHDSVDFMVMGGLCRRSCRKSPNHAFHAGSKWMIRQSPTLRRLVNIDIAAAHCRRALRRSQSMTMRRVLKSDDVLLIEQVDRLSRLQGGRLANAPRRS